MAMIRRLAGSEGVKEVLVRQVFRFWMGRHGASNDALILQAAYGAYGDNNGSMKALVGALVTSDAFLYRKVRN